MLNFELIVKKIKKAEGLKNDYELAKVFGLVPSDFNRRKKRGKLLEKVTSWASVKGIDLDDLLHGSGEDARPLQDRNTTPAKIIKHTPALDSHGTEMNEDNAPDQGTAVRMLLDIFESGDSKAVDAIYKNLEYFSTAAKRGQTDRRKVIDPDWPAEKERRIGGAGPKAPQG